MVQNVTTPQVAGGGFRSENLELVTKKSSFLADFFVYFCLRIFKFLEILRSFDFAKKDRIIMVLIR